MIFNLRHEPAYTFCTKRLGRKIYCKQFLNRYDSTFYLHSMSANSKGDMKSSVPHQGKI